jgi:hypothetical protein
VEGVRDAQSTAPAMEESEDLFNNLEKIEVLSDRFRTGVCKDKFRILMTSRLSRVAESKYQLEVPSL